MARQAQISLEYLILTAFVVVVVIIPIFIWVYSSATGSVHEKVTEQQANDLGGGLVDDAKQVYYLGIYSKKLVTYQLPVNIERMFVLDLEHAEAGVSRHHYYLGLLIVDSETRKYLFESKVPLKSDPTDPTKVVQDYYADKNSVDECTLSHPENTCTFYNFIGPTINTGKKVFKVETVLNSDGNATVAITPT